MTLNNELLSRLVTWAAEDNLRRSNPTLATEVGLVVTDADRASWHQGAWGSASRNGVCQTAFCIAGSAVAQSSDYIMLMAFSYKGNGRRHYDASVVFSKDALPEALPVGLEIEHGFLFADDYEAMYALRDRLGEDNVLPVAEAGRKALGLNEMQSGCLFSGGNTIEEVVAFARCFAEEAGETLMVPDWVITHYGSNMRATKMKPCECGDPACGSGYDIVPVEESQTIETV